SLTRRGAVLVACVLVVSAAAGVLWGVGDLTVGRGVVVSALAADSPLRAATPLREGDAVWRVNGHRVASVGEIDDEIKRTPAGGRVSLSVISRGEHVEWPGPAVTEEMRGAASPSGITGGGRTHSFRASGFTRHYETFAEQLQIIAQLALGFALAAWRRRARSREVEQRKSHGEGRRETRDERRSKWQVILPSVAFVLLAFGLSLTAMRTSTVAFAFGAAVVAYLATPREKQHFALAVDRGLPALLFWLWLMYVFWKMARRAEKMWRETADAGAHGLALGIAGALAGFLASSLVNYNFGDSEVALLVWWMMGAVVVLNEEKAA